MVSIRISCQIEKGKLYQSMFFHFQSPLNKLNYALISQEYSFVFLIVVCDSVLCMWTPITLIPSCNSVVKLKSL
jgi:hypothetical protein